VGDLAIKLNLTFKEYCANKTREWLNNFREQNLAEGQEMCRE